MRVRSPSTTLTLTETVSPGSNGGMVLASLVICSCSSCLIRFMEVSVGCAGNAGRNSAYQIRLVVTGRRSFYDKERALSPFRAGAVGTGVAGPLGAGPAGVPRIGRPQIRTALAGEALGLSLPPSRDFGVVAGGQYCGDRAAFPDCGPRELRVFEQAGGEAL